MTPDDVLHRISEPLSLRRRLATVLTALAGLAVAVLVGSQWATEPNLPVRTQVAFGVIVAGGLAWAVFGAWVLRRRLPLLALDRVIAAWLALVVSGVLVAVILLSGGRPAAVAVTAVFLVAAGTNLVRARARRAALLRLKRDLGG